MSTVVHPASESRTTLAGRAVAALRTETGLARVALGLGALHVVDDNFLQPEPGVSARDHLWGGLVQVALLVAFAWGYPRLRPGLRGILAVYVGIFMIVMGAGEAGYYSREDGPSGDDYTGLLMIPAGVLLVGIGVVTLWRSRKGGSVVRRYARRVALALGFLVTLPLVMFPFSEAFVVTHSARAVRADPAARRPARERLVHHERRTAPQRLVRSLEERCDGDRLPWPEGATENRRGCWSARATACSCSTGAARGRATATRTRSAGEARAIWPRRSPTSGAGRTSTRTASAGSGAPSAAR